MIMDKLTSFGKRRPVVAVLALNGVIGQMGGLRRGLSIGSIEKRLESAFSVRRLVAVAVSINSPGGAPVQSDLIAKRLRDLATEKDIPVFAFIEDVAASGGYWLACAGDEIYACNSSIVGSIGVVSGGFGFTDLIGKLGIERRLYTSGEKKAMNDPFGPEKPSEVKHLKALQKDIHNDFISMVKINRGERLNGAHNKLFTGSYWTGRQALELGLIDGIGDIRNVMREKFGKNIRFKFFDENRSWLQRRLSTQNQFIPGKGNDLGFARDLVVAIEERFLWNRFGL